MFTLEVCDEDMAPLIQAECDAVLEWIQHGERKGKGKHKSKTDESSSHHG